MAYRMTLKDGTRYELDNKGAVLARSDGPEGWDYSGQWIVTGFRRRWNSSMQVPLEDAADGADAGHGFVCDLDHGTRRMWGSPSGRRLDTLERI